MKKKLKNIDKSNYGNIQKIPFCNSFVIGTNTLNCIIKLIILTFLYFREESSEFRVRQVIENEAIDSKYGFERVRDHLTRTGFLLNMHAVSHLVNFNLFFLYLLFSSRKC